MNHIEQRANLWYAILIIPADVRHILGKARFLQSTQTSSRAEATVRANVLVLGWKAQIVKARGTAPSPKASFWESLRRDYINAPDEGTQTALHELAEAAARKVKDPGEGSRLYKFATDQMGTLLAPLVAEWKGSLRLAQKTIDQQHRDVSRMATHFISLEALTPPRIKTWTDKLLKEGTTASSFERIGNGCRSLWRHLQQSGARSMIDPDPFVGPFTLAQRTAQNNKMDRTAFTADELSKVYAAAVAQNDTPLVHLIALGAYTGARIEEICQLTTTTACDGVFTIGKSKTAAGVRKCPIHPAVAPLVDRLLAASSDGFLIPSTADNQYGNRSGPLSQRFGHLKKSMGFGKAHVFHSTRHTLSTLMYQAGCSKEVIADVVGHEKGNFTLDTYAKEGAHMAQKLAAISTVVYPGALGAP
jgi:integrase